MNVGDYIRTKDGVIGKIQRKNFIGYNDLIIDTLYYNDDEIIDDWTCGVKKYNIIKSSPQIIDLIEAGDYVNGKKVIDVYPDYIFDYSEEFRVIRFSETDILYNSKHIETVLTHEQMEAMQYRVEE